MVDIWRCNALAVRVFEQCQIKTLGGFSVRWEGISSEEIRSACDLLQIPPEQWPDLVGPVRYMGSVASNAFNKRAAASEQSK